MRRILIIGGGTGGTMLANKLHGREFDVTLLSASSKHMFQPSLLYLAFANASASFVRDESRLLSRHVRYVQERATHVDLKARTVKTEAGSRYDYDNLVLATGAHIDPRQIAGLSEINERFGDYHSSIAQARKLWTAIDMFAGGAIVLGQASPICVCPPSPLEGILLLDRLLRKKGIRDSARLVFFTPFPRAYSAPEINDIVEPILKERGVEVLPFFDLDRIDPATRTISSIEGDTIEYDLPIVIPPFAGTDITFEPVDVIDADRFIKVDKETLRVKGFDSAFSIGDAANLPTSKAGVGAHLEAQVVARQLAGRRAIFDGRTNCPMDLGDGRGTFVIGSYDAPVVKIRPSRLNHLMKIMMGWFYWISLSGILDPMFDLYFWMSKPPRRAVRANKKVQHTQ